MRLVWPISPEQIANIAITLSAPRARGPVAPSVQGVQITSLSITTDGIWYVLNTGISPWIFDVARQQLSWHRHRKLEIVGQTMNVLALDYSSLPGGSLYQGSSTGAIVQYPAADAARERHR